MYRTNVIIRKAAKGALEVGLVLAGMDYGGWMRIQRTAECLDGACRGMSFTADCVGRTRVLMLTMSWQVRAPNCIYLTNRSLLTSNYYRPLGVTNEIGNHHLHCA